MAPIKILKRLKKPKFLAVDFFCGAGGTTRGLIDAGGYVIAGIDKDNQCSTTYSSNNANITIDKAQARFINLDIFPKSWKCPQGQQNELMTELSQLIKSYKQAAPKTPMLFAICAPCQPFTKLSRKEMSDKRKAIRQRDRNLLKEACKFVAKFKPEMVLSENVAGISDPKYGGIWEQFKKDLEKLGYVTGTKVVCTSKFGVPQYRKRSILMAVKKNLVRAERFADILKEELLVPDSDPNSVMVSVSKALHGLPVIKAGERHPRIKNHRSRALSDLNYKRLSSAKPGESNLYMRNTRYGDLSLACHRRVNKKMGSSCFSDVYTRMHPDRPSPTITTKCHSISNGRFGHFDPKQVRGISLREAAMLQSFPRNYVFYPEDSIDPVARMIGNAVPPKLASFFAEYLTDAIKSRAS